MNSIPTDSWHEGDALIIKRVDAIALSIPLKKPVIMAGVRLDIFWCV